MRTPARWCDGGRTHRLRGGFMGFYVRKSVSVGPIRFNLSGSGVGMSVGVRGLRVGAGPRGNYVRIGAKGVYYQQLFPSDRVAPNTPLVPPESSAGMQEIMSAPAAQISDSSSEQL